MQLETVVNRQIALRMTECGFKSVSDLCRRSGLSRRDISGLVKMQSSALRLDGGWRRPASSLAEALGCTCDVLFPQSRRAITNGTQKAWPLARRSKRQSNPAAARPAVLENPVERLIEEVDSVAKKQAVRRALNSLRLKARDRRILEGRFGLGCEEQTLEALAREFHVSPQRIQHRLHLILRLLREDQGKAGRWLLQAHRPADAMGLVHEARLRNIQHPVPRDLPRRRLPAPLQLAHPVETRSYTSMNLSKQPT